jgi:chemotaxis protein MotB
VSAHAVAATAKAGRRKKHEEHEEHENHERWLVTYADMITLLMVLFIVLFAIGQTDLEKFRRLQVGLNDAFGTEIPGVLEASGEGILNDSAAFGVERAAEAQAAIQALDAARRAIAEDRVALESTQAELDARLSALGVREDVDLRLDARGLIVTIVTDQVLFAPGSDVVLGEGRSILAAIGGALLDLPNDVGVEGHTDDVPISTARFHSNWELSTARATSVLQLLVETTGIAPSRLSAAGYADTHPIADNSTTEGRAANRRVEVVVHSSLDEADVVNDVAGVEAPPTTLDPIVDPIPEASHGQEEG